MLKSLFPWNRNSDPATSRQVSTIKRRGEVHLAVLKALSQGDATGSDVAVRANLPRDNVTPALNRLWKQGLVGKRDYAKLPTLSFGTKFQQVWFLTAKGSKVVLENRS